MGSRGASSGVADNGKPYGTEYRTVLKSGNIKFVKPTAGNTTAPMETMTKGRVYVTLDYKDEPKFITYYDTTNKRVKQIDLDPDRPHKGMTPHTHHGYNHNENDGPKGASNPTAEEMKMVERIKKIWYTKRGKP